MYRTHLGNILSKNSKKLTIFTPRPTVTLHLNVTKWSFKFINFSLTKTYALSFNNFDLTDNLLYFVSENKPTQTAEILVYVAAIDCQAGGKETLLILLKARAVFA